ncbi:unnamed protein product [Caenorhabditis sp. 36 PRJEB53466]|nr:unnamed protein product [Caenorhabditis sp. 36 PRJEB53466]
MIGYGSQKTSVLSNLTPHSIQEIQDYSVVFEDWRNGSDFMTTIITPAPTPITESTKMPADFWNNNLYTVNKDTISG